MIIEQAILHNFGPYKGEHVLDLSPSGPDKPIILLGGMNGSGKTTLLDAILLCLYGPVAKTSNRGSMGYHTYLRECVHRQARPNEASVGLRFQEYRAGRKATFDLVRSWQVKSTVSESLRVHVDGEEDLLLAENWLDYFESIVPLRIANLFFFDGEKIEAFADIDNSKAIFESAVESLLGLDLMSQLSDDLLTLERKKSLESKDDTEREEIGRLTEEITEAEDQKVDLRNALAAKRERLNQAEKNLRVANAKYVRKGGKYYEQREALKAEEQRQQGDLYEAEQRVRELAAGEAPLLLVEDILNEVILQAECEVRAEDATAVCRILDKRDQKLLDKLSKTLSSGEIEKISEFLSKDRGSYRDRANSECYLLMSGQGLNDARAVKAILPRIRKDFQAAKTRREGCAKALAQTQERIQAIPLPEIIQPLVENLERWQKEVAEHKKSLEVMGSDLGTIENRLSQLKNSLNNRIADGLKEEFDADDSGRVIAYSESARETLSQLRHRVLHTHLAQIESLITECFGQLAKKDSLIERIAISPDDYSLELFGKGGGHLNPSRLSAGERQLLAVSMLWGLGKAAGVELPVVIDTPLGRLDGHHRSQLVCSYFPQAGNQVLILSTDEEIAAGHLQELSSAISKTYLISHDEEAESSSIIPGYFAGQESYHAN